jgi:hypothetical protein
MKLFARLIAAISVAGLTCALLLPSAASAADNSTCQGYNPQTAGIDGPSSLNGTQPDSGTCVTVTVAAGTATVGATVTTGSSSTPTGSATPPGSTTNSSGTSPGSTSGESPGSSSTAPGTAANSTAPGQIQHLTEGELPFTGFDPRPLLLSGVLLLGLGLVVRRYARRDA